MSEVAIALLLLIGSAFLLLAAIGIIRMPDLYSRIQAAAKAATLGAGCIVIALAIHFSDFGITVRAFLIVAFLFLTAPVAGHWAGGEETMLTQTNVLPPDLTLGVGLALGIMLTGFLTIMVLERFGSRQETLVDEQT